MTNEATESFFLEARRIYQRALAQCYSQTPEWRGKIMRPKPGSPIVGLSIPMSFSRTLIDLAGGMHNLREHWEVEPEPTKG